MKPKATPLTLTKADPQVLALSFSTTTSPLWTSLHGPRCATYISGPVNNKRFSSPVSWWLLLRATHNHNNHNGQTSPKIPQPISGKMGFESRSVWAQSPVSQARHFLACPSQSPLWVPSAPACFKRWLFPWYRLSHCSSESPHAACVQQGILMLSFNAAALTCLCPNGSVSIGENTAFYYKFQEGFSFLLTQVCVIWFCMSMYCIYNQRKQ